MSGVRINLTRVSVTVGDIAVAADVAVATGAAFDAAVVTTGTITAEAHVSGLSAASTEDVETQQVTLMGLPVFHKVVVVFADLSDQPDPAGSLTRLASSSSTRITVRYWHRVLV